MKCKSNPGDPTGWREEGGMFPLYSSQCDQQLQLDTTDLLKAYSGLTSIYFTVTFSNLSSTMGHRTPSYTD